jgi:hypothetical protein
MIHVVHFLYSNEVVRRFIVNLEEFKTPLLDSCYSSEKCKLFMKEQQIPDRSVCGNHRVGNFNIPLTFSSTLLLTRLKKHQHRALTFFLRSEPRRDVNKFFIATPPKTLKNCAIDEKTKETDFFNNKTKQRAKEQ